MWEKLLGAGAVLLGIVIVAGLVSVLQGCKSSNAPANAPAAEVAIAKLLANTPSVIATPSAKALQSSIPAAIDWLQGPGATADLNSANLVLNGMINTGLAASAGPIVALIGQQLDGILATGETLGEAALIAQITQQLQQVLDGANDYLKGTVPAAPDTTAVATKDMPRAPMPRTFLTVMPGKK
jgi:hypothetical protein